MVPNPPGAADAVRAADLHRSTAYACGPAPVRVAQLAVVDAVGAFALLRGSVRHRRLVL